MDSTKKGWDIAKIKGMFEANIAKQIIQTPIQWSAGLDLLWWPSTKSGEYTVKTGYYEAKKHNQTTDLGPSTSDMVDGILWKTIWALKIPQKLKYFLGKVCHNILPVMENLCKKRVFQSGLCPICQQEGESIEHLFFFCEWVRPVWFGLQQQSVPRREDVTNFQNWLYMKFRAPNQHPNKWLFDSIATCCTLWIIWKYKISFCFEGKAVNPLAAVIQINQIIKEYYDFTEMWINIVPTYL